MSTFPSFIAGNNNSFFIGTNGNIGIGTTNPSTSLYVSGSSILSSGATFGSLLNNGFQIAPNNTTSNMINLNFSNLYIHNDTSCFLKYSGNGTLGSGFTSQNIDGPILAGHNGFIIGNSTWPNIIGNSSGIIVPGATTIGSISFNGNSAVQFCSGTSAGGGSQSGNVSFPFTFNNTPIVVANINSSSTTQVFSVTIWNQSTTGFSYSKNYISSNAAGGGASTGESFNWIALG